VDVVGRGAGVAAEQLAAVLADPAELHVVVLLFLGLAQGSLLQLALSLRLQLRVLVLGFPLDTFFLLFETERERKRKKIRRAIRLQRRCAVPFGRPPSPMGPSGSKLGEPDSRSAGSSTCPRVPSPSQDPNRPCGRPGGRCHTGLSRPLAGRPRSNPGGLSHSHLHLRPRLL